MRSVSLSRQLKAWKARRRAKKHHRDVYDGNWDTARREFLRRLHAVPDLHTQITNARSSQQAENTERKRMVT
jgi:hypothetical protein